MYRVRFDMDMCMCCMCCDKPGSHPDDMMDGLFVVQRTCS